MELLEAISSFSNTPANEVDEDEWGVTDVYCDYKPSKLSIGRNHPDPVVETASLSSVQPPDVYFTLSLPQETIESGSLSALQLEAIVYASQQHEIYLPDGSRAGFLIGDGAGAGKGRTLAGIIFDNYLNRRKKALWISVSKELKNDVYRDFRDIGASQIPLNSIHQLKYEPIASKVNGFIKKGVIFLTYSLLSSETSQSCSAFKSRLNQIIDWCGKDFDGVIVFDECHRAKNCCPLKGKPTKTGINVLKLQSELPNARIVYASATGASEVREMAYMSRLGIWGIGTPFRDFHVFRAAVERRGVGALEIVAMEMKTRGMYIARQLSFHGASFSIDKVTLSPDFINIYDKAVDLWIEAKLGLEEASRLLDTKSTNMWAYFWAAHQRFFKYLCIAAKLNRIVELTQQSLEDGKCVVIGLQSTGEARTLELLERENGDLSDFVCTPKEVFRTLIEKQFPSGAYHNRANDNTQKRTNYSNILTNIKRPTSSHLNECEEKSCPLNENFSWPSNSSQSNECRNVIRKSFPVKKFGNSSSNYTADQFVESNSLDDDNDFYPNSEDSHSYLLDDQRHFVENSFTQDSDEKQLSMYEEADIIKKNLLVKIEELGEFLPTNTIDTLINDLGGPEAVAELTGRRGRILKENANIKYESRSADNTDMIISKEKELFMAGVKHIAIISEAASTGISLQSDRRVKNQKRRVHITIELPWSADKAVQQFGRTHRSNQVNAPEYIFIISDLAGEKRFASVIAKRMESLGALTHGDRRAAGTRDLSSFHINNNYGTEALTIILNLIADIDMTSEFVPFDYDHDLLKNIAIALTHVGIFEANDPINPKKLQLPKNPIKIDKFLNRILGIPVDMQNTLFKLFTDTLEAIVLNAIETGNYDLGILDFDGSSENVHRVNTVMFYRQMSSGMVIIYLHTLQVERGMTFEAAYNRWLKLSGSNQGFYASTKSYYNRQAVLVEAFDSSLNTSLQYEHQISKKLYFIYKPHLGKLFKKLSLNEIEKNFACIDIDEAKNIWEHQYNLSNTMCSHVYLNNYCKARSVGTECDYGMRKRTYYVLSGSILNIWPRLEEIIGPQMKIVRIQTVDGLKIVGTIVPKSKVDKLKKDIAFDSAKVAVDDTISNFNSCLGTK